MATRKELIVIKYVALESELKKHFDAELFPSLDSIDMCDLVFFLTLTFTGITEESDYRNKIAELLVANQIKVTDETLDTVYVLVMEFIVWLKNL